MIDTTGKCSACGQTVGIDTIHTCSPQVTAPTPERRVGEARVAELAALEIVDEALGLSAEVQCQRILYNEKVRVARDLLDERAAVARLTAGVERLTKQRAEAMAVAMDALGMSECAGRVNPCEHCRDLRARFAALALPTNAPEATE